MIKAFLLAAGMGKRLGELGKNIPKCLVPIGNKTLLDRVISQLKSLPIESAVINSFHKAEVLKNYINEHTLPFPIEISEETSLLGTGGGLLYAREKLLAKPEPEFILIHNTDVVHDFAISHLLDRIEQSKADAVLLTAKRDTLRPLLFSKAGKLLGHRDKQKGIESIVEPLDKTANERGFCGVSLIRTSLLKHYASVATEFSLITFYLEQLAAGKTIIECDLGDAFWIDAGTPERLAELARIIHE